MGLIQSKSSEEMMSTAPFSPEIVNITSELDPRSPTASIVRTPIQFLKRFEEGNCKVENNQGTPTEVELISDPRSPTTEFVRTPLVVSGNENTPTLRIHNKNLDKARRSFCPTTDTKYGLTKHTNESLKNSPSKPTNVVPPKLLESSPISVKPDHYKRKSFVGLLETNIDFTETDLDSVVNKRNYSQSSLCEETDCKTTDINSRFNEQIEEKTSLIEEPSSPNKSGSGFKEQIEEKLEKISLIEDGLTENQSDNTPEEKCRVSASESDNRTQSFESEKNRIIETVTDEIKKEDLQENLVIINEKAQGIINSNLVTESIQIKVVAEDRPSELSKAKQVLNNNENNGRFGVVDILADIRDFDKKLTNLIYEDNIEALPVQPKKTGGNRTPLKNRNSNSEPKRLSRLKVSDKPRRSLYGGPSRIPVFKNTAGKKIAIQCENTPPRESRPKRTSKAHWDTEKTMII